MSNEAIVILGAGVAGLGAAHELRALGHSAVIYEKAGRWGGLCDNFTVGGFTFDTAIHLSFTHDVYVKEVFAKSSPSLTHKPESSNYADGHWVRHPVQANLNAFPVDERIKIILGFIEAHQKSPDKNASYANYEEWLKAQFGNYFTERYPGRYTRKYWTLEARDLTTEWVGPRFYVPKIEEILHSAMASDSTNRYYATEMRYPVQGGYRQFLKGMADASDIRFGKQATGIDLKNRTVAFSDGTEVRFDMLISSLPLPVLVPLIRQAPQDVRAAAQKLLWTSVALVSLGFSRKLATERDLWFYIYDEDIVPSRGYWPSMKSPANAPDGRSSLQFEIYHSKHKPLPVSLSELKDRVIDQCIRLGLFERSDIEVADVRNLEFGNVVFDFDYAASKKRVRTYLADQGIESIGRFGDWDYLWSDQSMMSGVRAARRLAGLGGAGG